MRYLPADKSLYIRNRKKLFNLLPENCLAVIHSNDQLTRNGDQYFPYRQHSDFYYLTGIDQEKSILLLHKLSGSEQYEEVLFLIRTDQKIEIWEGPKLSQTEAQELSGIRMVSWLDNFDQVFKEYTGKVEKVFLNLADIPDNSTLPVLKDRRFAEELRKSHPGIQIRSLKPWLTSLRMIKEPEELTLIREAISVTRSAFLGILPVVRPGAYEYEIEAEIIRHFIRRGASGHAYHPIIASGKNACILHYLKNDSVCQEGDLLLLDFGAEYGNYAADCSRTLPVNGRFTGRQLDLYQSTLRVFRKAIRLMVPGTTIAYIQEQVSGYWEEEHIALGLYTRQDLQNQEEDKMLVKKYFPHGVSHFLGLDVHDVGDKTESLKPGMVLTCEPGIYIMEEQTGIRLENNILIRDEGPEDLMADIPVEPDEIEQLMRH